MFSLAHFKKSKIFLGLGVVLAAESEENNLVGKCDSQGEKYEYDYNKFYLFAAKVFKIVF